MAEIQPVWRGDNATKVDFVIGPAILKFDDSVKSRHSGENRSPDQLEPFDITGFRLSPE